MRRLRIIGAAVIVLAFMVVNTARGADACKGGAKAAQRSCTAGAKSDYALALGKCANIANSAAQKACRAQAKADLAGAMSECQDLLDARLGPAIDWAEASTIRQSIRRTSAPR